MSAIFTRLRWVQTPLVSVVLANGLPLGGGFARLSHHCNPCVQLDGPLELGGFAKLTWYDPPLAA